MKVSRDAPCYINLLLMSSFMTQWLGETLAMWAGSQDHEMPLLKSSVSFS